MKYDITAVVEGYTAEDLAKKIIAACYYFDLEVTELKLELQHHQANVSLEETESFQFPKTRQLLQHLNEGNDE